MPVTFFLLNDLSLNSFQAEEIIQRRNEKNLKCYRIAEGGRGALKGREKVLKGERRPCLQNILCIEGPRQEFKTFTISEGQPLAIH